MHFLHKHKVLFRDLKPDNVGFDCQDNIRIFDFGLARKLDGASPRERHLTMQVGSLRYMSPEVFCSNTGRAYYDFSADVHSFAILLWEVITLETPFHQAKNIQEFTKLVFRRKKRPCLRLVASHSIRGLLDTSWDSNPSLRPSFSSIVLQLNSSHESTTQATEISRFCRLTR